jgi:hypothetical protein
MQPIAPRPAGKEKLAFRGFSGYHPPNQGTQKVGEERLGE